MSEKFTENIVRYCPKCWLDYESFKSKRGQNLKSAPSFQDHIGKCKVVISTKMKNLVNLTKVGCQIITYINLKVSLSFKKSFCFINPLTPRPISKNTCRLEIRNRF